MCAQSELLATSEAWLNNLDDLDNLNMQKDRRSQQILSPLLLRLCNAIPLLEDAGHSPSQGDSRGNSYNIQLFIL